ncbi:MAG: AAA family ATPase [Chloroflexi bacterium]|nr:AAA family ATPase [Chloroflexota bacterium]
MFKLFLFGTPQLQNKDQPIEFDTRKAIALLAYLAVTRATHSRDSLATLFYPESDQTRARASFRRTLSTLNAALSDDILEIDRESIGLNPRAKLATDVVEFQQVLETHKAHQHPPTELCAQCVALLKRAAELYRGDFLAGFYLRDSPDYDDWQFFTAENLRREFATVLEKLVCYQTDKKAYDSAIEYARRWLALDSLHEPAHRQLMQLYALTDQRAAALRQYDECVRVLEKELGVTPLEETTALYRKIKEQKHPVVSEQWTVHSEPLPLAPSQYPLVGRAAELETLKRTYANIQTNGHLLAVEGEAGIGKTRLAEEFLACVREQGAIILTGRAYEGESNLAYGIFVEALRVLIDHPDLRAKIPSAWLAEVARLVPEIGEAATTLPLDTAGARGRFFEGISQTIFAVTRGKIPGILFLDDLQWADRASLDLLMYIVQQLRGRPFAILATWRNDDAVSVERLHQVSAPVQRSRTASIIRLPRLAPLAVTQLVTSVIGEAATLAQKISERLQRETNGLPFFVVEYLNALDQGNAQADDWSLPNGVRDLLHARLAIASETGKQLLSAAAVIGCSFDFDTLREASGRTEEETIKTLEELIAQGLVKEIATENLRFDFSHEKLRALAYEETSAARRRLLHRRVAESMINTSRSHHDTNAFANQIAKHYQLAGADALAAEYYKIAGDHARALYANAEALAHYGSALTFGFPDVASLHESIGDMQTLLGDYGNALTSYETAANFCEPSALASIEHKRGNVHHRRGEYALATSHFQTAINAMPENTSLDKRARLLVDWSLTAHALGEAKRAEEMVTRGLALAESTHDKRSIAQARDILGILARARGDNQHARYQLEQSCAIAESLNDPNVRIAALNNLALVCRDTNELDRAIKLTETALALCESIGDRHLQAALLNNLADLFHASGKDDESMRYLQKAVTIFAEIETEAGTMQPEIWKLVEW